MRIRLSIAACCLLAACGSDPVAAPDENVRNETVPDAPPPPVAMNTLANSSADSGVPTSSANTGQSATSAAPDRASPEAAVAVIQRYYRAIDTGDYRDAYALWAQQGEASRQSFADFKRGFAHTRSTIVAVGKPGNQEGAAGSTYISIPVTVSAITDQGEQQHFAGTYQLRRVNDVDGVTDAQLHWHIRSATLRRTE